MKKHAFTLIEMLMIVAIIGILVGVAVPALNTAREDAITARRKAIQAIIATAKTRLVLDISAENFPATEEERWKAIQPYLMVNGKPVTHKDQLLGNQYDYGKEIFVGAINEDPIFWKELPPASAYPTPKPATTVVKTEDSAPTIKPLATAAPTSVPTAPPNTPEKTAETGTLTPMETVPSEPPDVSLE